MSAFDKTCYVAGMGCTCAAYNSNECCCDVGWTNPKVYELESKLEDYKDFINDLRDVFELPLLLTSKAGLIQDMLNEFIGDKE